MIYKIENKKMKITLKNEIMELPIKLKEEINKNFENMKKTGANIWNGEVLCVSECNIEEDKIEIIWIQVKFLDTFFHEFLQIYQALLEELL